MFSNMRRNALHIVLLVVLGLYYNSAPALWLAYSTVAKNFFVEHCENPTKPCCQGKCKIKHIEDHSASAEKSSPQIQTTEPQPSITTSFCIIKPVREHQIVQTEFSCAPLRGIIVSPFHPPRA